MTLDKIRELTETLPAEPTGPLPEEIRAVLDDQQRTLEMLTMAVSNLTTLVYPMRHKVRELEKIIDFITTQDGREV